VSNGKQSGGGLSPKTLLIAGAASAITTIIVPLLWRPGTLYAAAATPVVVALVTEALKRPVDTVTAATARSAAALSSKSKTAQAVTGGTGTAVQEPDAEETFDPLAPPTADELARLNAPAPPPPRTDERRGGSGHRWKVAIVTGLLAFVAAAAVVTFLELTVFGDSVTSGKERTSLFGGSTRRSRATPTPTPTRTPTPTPSATPTPTTSATATPTPTATPAQPGAAATPAAPAAAAPTTQPTPAP
jgi:hypothetical protein